MPEYFLEAAIWLQFEEGLRLRPYHCSEGRLTVGYGRNIQDKGISRQESDLIANWNHHQGRFPEFSMFHPFPIKIGDSWIIGYGHNLSKWGISGDIAEILLLNDMQESRDWLETYKWWDDLSHPRKCAVMSMAFQLGQTRFKGFRNTIKYLSQGLYKHAGDEAMDSRWAKQTPARAARVANCIRENRLPEIVIKRIREVAA